MRANESCFRTVLTSIALLAFAALPALAQTTMTATLNGANERPGPGDPDATGFAVVDIDLESATVHYSIVANDVVSPSSAHIHAGTSEVSGGIVVDLAPDFEDGVATGRVPADPAVLEAILADPAAFYVNVHNAEYPAGAIRGQLTVSRTDTTYAVFPVAGSVAGAAMTFFRTDLALLNRLDEDTTVVLEYYAAGRSESTPSAVATVPLASNQQQFLFDVIQDTFDLPAGSTGAIRVLAPQRIVAVGRIYNDQRPVDGGTYGQFVPAMHGEHERTRGSLPMLGHEHPSTRMGSRTNIGWFNDSGETVTLVLRAHQSDGDILEATSRSVAPRAQMQETLSQLFPSVEPMETLYVTFTTSDAPLYVYASVVDNLTGDAIFIPAQE